MKKIYAYILVIIVATTGCGKNKSNIYIENDTFGILPSLYDHLDNEMEKISELKKEEVERAINEDDIAAIYFKYMTLENEIRDKYYDLASNERERLKGRSVPFEQSEMLRFDIKSLTISDIDITTGTIFLIVELTSRSSTQVNTSLYVPYKIFDTENAEIVSERVYPFLGLIGESEPYMKPAEHVDAGSSLNKNGSHILLYCRAYDLTYFSKIIFYDSL